MATQIYPVRCSYLPIRQLSHRDPPNYLIPCSPGPLPSQIRPWRNPQIPRSPLLSLPSLWLFPSCLRVLVARPPTFTLVARPVQVSRVLYKSDFFCKTNPISKTLKPTQPPIPQRLTPISRPAPLEKTNRAPS